ncbi:M61 family metallopeptidase [Hymenobacter setariae]|uniref:M61 family metallopeptidase n=1 Tax=Hymenobacter setariae TaxID=2594794 RepID=A0A558C1H8_9BACT|nr:PDZ domain-containing protein [Hymenobacter setariae]TVT42651.1 M61 family metallopeptidase [Hymenobacter setariae]
MLKTASALGRATLVLGLLAAVPVAAQTKVKTKVKKGTTTATAAPADKGNASLRYTLAMPAPQTHYFEVKMELRGFDREYTDIKMPVWAPGSYLVREFARHVERLQATAGGQPLAVEKLDKNTWRVRHPKQSNFQVNYGVYAYELSVRTSYIDADHGFALGSSIFMYPAGYKDLSSQVTVQPAAGWSTVSTALRPAAGMQKFTYQSANYDELADSPIEVGSQKVLNFTANNTPHQMAMFGPFTADEPRLLADMKRVTEAAQRVVGQNPLDHYLFIVHHTEAGGGGLEHLYSTTLGARPGTYSSEVGYKNFMRLVAHEYFHLWNVKRIRPIALGPFDYDRENYTHMLWVSEGQTEYMANQITQRAGFYTPQEYFDILAGVISGVENQPGNKFQPVAMSSFDAWIRGYRPDENSKNSEISYYDKGELVGMVLDLMIVQATNGQKHIDDVFRLLYDKYYKGLKRGFTDQEYQDAVAEVAGRRYDDFFQNCVYGTRTLDYATALGYVGLGITSAPASPNGSLGATIASRGGRFVVTFVKRDGVAWNGGLNVNDEILQLNGAAPTEDALRQAILSSPASTTLKLQVKHGAQTHDLNLTLAPDPDRKYQIQPLATATPDQQRLLAKWLSK